jgi:hypothetical protein
MPDFRNLSAKPYVIMTYLGPDGKHIEVSETNPLPGLGGQGGAGGGEAVPTVVYSPEFLTVGVTEAVLNPPVGATHAYINVLTNAVLMGATTSTNAPAYTANQGAGISGAELAAWRLIRSGGTDATIRVDYWKEQVTAEPAVPAITPPTSVAANIPTGTSTGAEAILGGMTVVRILIGAAWTAAAMSFETSNDGVTWYPLYDNFGSLVSYTVAANRAINVPVGDLLRVNRMRVRSGVPGTYVNQASGATVSLVTAGV